MKAGWRYLKNLILIFVIGYGVIIYPAYLLFTAHYPIAKQVGDTEFLLGSFANGPTPAGQSCNFARCFANADIAMAKNPILRPFAEYLLGVLMDLQRSAGGNVIYFMGHVSGSGGILYFPLLYLLKEPIPTLLIVFIALALGVASIVRKMFEHRRARDNVRAVIDYIGVNFAEFSMASFVVLYWGVSIRSPLNIGLRHVLPTIPFILILAAGAWKKWVMNFDVGRLMASACGRRSTAHRSSPRRCERSPLRC